MSNNNQVFISITASKKEHPFMGYTLVGLPFHNLHKAVQATPYCIHSFENEYRKKTNVLLTGNILVVDIDNDQHDEEGGLYRLTYEEANKLAAPYKSLIITTGSHQKDKGDQGIEDRYRILFYLDTPLNPALATYDILVVDCLKELGFYKYADKGASKDMAKYFKVSPEDAIYHYSESQDAYDWTKHDITPPEPEATYSQNNYSNSGELQDIKEDMTYEFLAFTAEYQFPKQKTHKQKHTTHAHSTTHQERQASM